MLEPLEYIPKVLVVDDDIFMMSLIEKIFEGTGYSIIKAHDGEDGLHKVTAEEPDLIILDVMMPKIDGLEVCRRLKSNEATRSIPVVMLTSKDFLEDKITGLETGADDYITKPFNTKEFLLRIRGLVDRKIYQTKKTQEEKLQALEKMADDIAHEVRNPVVAIGGFARRIRDRLPLEDALRIYADHIIREVERLESMLKQVIRFKTIVVSIRDAIDVQYAVEKGLAGCRDLLQQKSIQVVRQYDEQIPRIRGDAGNLKDAFSHIIVNAIESIDSEGRIVLKIVRAEQRVIISISDTGRGIPKSEIPHVVRPFYTSKMSGAGMGLTMVKHIIDFHNGEMTIASKGSEGTRVTVSLPTCVAGQS